MQIKKFEAKDMGEAFRLIKKEFGPDAVILHAKTLGKKSTISTSCGEKPGVIVTAAIDKPCPVFAQEKISEGENSIKSQKILGEKVSPKKEKGPDMFKPVKTFFTNIREEIHGKKHLNDEEIRQGLLLNILSRGGINKDIVQNLIADLNIKGLSEEFLKETDPEESLLNLLEECKVFAKPVEIEPGLQKIVCLAGPSGVGKTSTIAKIAAYYRVKKQINVGLISLDDSRIGAIEQIDIYAKIIGCPLEIASDVDELKVSLKRLEECPLVLIDTGGINHRNQEDVVCLKSLLKQIPSVEVHLVLGGTTRHMDLADIIRGFNIISLDRIIFTKLDETDDFKSILNLLISTKIPVSYFTNGQKVTHDILPASPRLMVDMILGIKKEEKNICKLEPLKTGRKKEMNQEAVDSIEYFISDINQNDFHSPDCKKMEHINFENIVVFGNIQEAIDKDFVPCKLCASIEVEAYYRFFTTDNKRAVGDHI